MFLIDSKYYRHNVGEKPCQLIYAAHINKQTFSVNTDLRS